MPTNLQLDKKSLSSRFGSVAFLAAFLVLANAKSAVEPETLPKSERVFLQAEDDDPDEEVWTYWRKTEDGCRVLDEMNFVDIKYRWTGQCVAGHAEGCGILSIHKGNSISLESMVLRQFGCYVAGRKNGKIEVTLFSEDSNKSYAMFYENGVWGDIAEDMRDVPLQSWQLAIKAEEKAARERKVAARKAQLARQAELAAQQARQAEHDARQRAEDEQFSSNVLGFVSGLASVYAAKKGNTTPVASSSRATPSAASSATSNKHYLSEIGPRCVIAKLTKPHYTEFKNRCAEKILVSWQSEENMQEDPSLTPANAITLEPGEAKETFTQGAVRYMACPDFYSGFKVHRERWGCYYQAR